MRMIFDKFATMFFTCSIKLFFPQNCGGGVMKLAEVWQEGMSSEHPGCVFGLLQLILGRQVGEGQTSSGRYVGADELYGGNGGDHIET